MGSTHQYDNISSAAAGLVTGLVARLATGLTTGLTNVQLLELVQVVWTAC